MKKLKSVLLFVVLLPLILFSGCVSVSHQPAEAVRYTTLFDRITIEIAPVGPSVVNYLKLAVLINNLDFYSICPKKNISYSVLPKIYSSRRRWHSYDIVDFEDFYRTNWDGNRSDRHLKVFIACFPGRYIEDGMTTISGLKYGKHQSIAMFRGNFDPEMILHEFGHIIGLVDRKTRRDKPINPKRANHCNTKSCVMFWKVKDNAVFDPKCVRDILKLIKRSR